MASLTLSAPAKLNLHLAVLDRGADGYRHLETLFVAIDFCDQVHLETTDQPGVELEVVGDAGGAVGDDNLVARAAHCFFEAADVTGGVAITLEKTIPPGAGLGGGSSDAGATLRGLNTLFGSPLDQDDLARVGAPLGADVPFFATGAKAAWGFGRGDRLLLFPALESRPVVLALPNEGLSTVQVYGALNRARDESGEDGWPGGTAHWVDRWSAWEHITAHGRNDFESVAQSLLPGLKGLLAGLSDAEGAEMARMSGSGSAHFAVFRTEAEAQRAAERLRESHPAVQFHVVDTVG